MGSGDVSFVLLAILGGAIALGLAIALIVIAVKVTGGILKAIGWLVAHLAKFVGGIVSDVAILVGAIIATVVAIPFSTFNVVLGRWESARRWGGTLKREALTVGYRFYSIALRRPLQLLCLDGILGGIERSVPSGIADSAESAGAAGSPNPDRAERRMGPSEFEGYTIEGTLRPGGSGAKLYIAKPDDDLRRRLNIGSPRVVIKSFALEEGSSLPQIVRESRALDSARALGLVFDHGLDNGRFWYAMPYHPGESLGETTRFLHARAGGDGLRSEELAEAIGFARDLVATLTRYHDGGLWHKDVKPDNIIVHDGRAHLVDLGLVTPLRSAMTLTTHGTEYFRDPEMVRQALRGVRVHQVDGGKFDVYGAGAVLYFLLENTFPAHGGLSSFMKRSPEALRWIVRRAMADYHQRYVNARAMLDDLEAVANASDPWSLRPIQLPSMRSADMSAVGDASPLPPVPPAAAVGAGVGAGFGLGGNAAAAGFAGMGGARGAAPTWGAGFAAAAIPQRPRLAVTNWWSGSYGPAGAAMQMPHVQAAAAAREAARAARDAVKAHRAARRARRACPSPKASAIGYLVPLAFAIIAIVAMSRGGGGGAASTAPESALAKAVAPKRLKAPIDGAKLMLINNHPALANPEVEALVENVVESFEKAGFKVVRDDEEASAKLSLELAKQHAANTVGAGDSQAQAAEVDAILATSGYFGALQVEAASGDGSPAERFVAKPVGANFRNAIDEAKQRKGSKSRSSSKSGGSSASVPAPSAPEAPAGPAQPAISFSADDVRLPAGELSATLLASRPACASGFEGSMRRLAWPTPQGALTTRHGTHARIRAAFSAT